MSDKESLPSQGSSSLQRRAILRRLVKRSEFLTVQRHGVKQVMPCLILQAHHHKLDRLPGQPKTPKTKSGTYVGFTASRKVGNAVARNRAKRRMRVLARLLLTEQEVHDAYSFCDDSATRTDYVFIARQNMLTISWADALAQAKNAMESVHKKLDKRHDGHSK